MIPENLVLLLLWESAVAIALIIIILLIILLELLKKYVVTVTVVTVKTEAASYDHGDTVNISGNVSVDGKPVPDTTVSLKVVDSTSAEFVVGDVTTDADGNFSAAWIIPPEVAPGTVELSATALGATATTTFTFNNKCGRVSRRCLGLKV